MAVNGEARFSHRPRDARPGVVEDAAAQGHQEDFPALYIGGIKWPRYGKIMVILIDFASI